MTSQTKKTCIICACLLTEKDKAFSLAAKAKEQSFICGDVIQYLFKDLKILNGELWGWEPTKNLREEKRYVCQPCLVPLKTSYMNLKTVMDRMSSDSILKSHIVVKENDKGFVPEKKNQSTDTEGLTDGVKQDRALSFETPKKAVILPAYKTPILQKMRVALSRKKESVTVRNEIRKIVHDEMRKYAETSSLKQFNANDGYYRDDDTLDVELQATCPTVFEIVKGMFRKEAEGRGQAKKVRNQSQEVVKRDEQKAAQFRARLRVAIGIAAFTQNRLCNGFQKAMSVKLYQSKAPKRMFAAFNHMGLSCSYDATLGIVDEIRKTYDEQLVTWKNNAEKFLRSCAKKLSTANEGTSRMEIDEAESEEEMVERMPEPINVDNFLDKMMKEGFNSKDIPVSHRPTFSPYSVASLSLYDQRRNLPRQSLKQPGLPFGKGLHKNDMPLEDGFFYGISLTFDNLNKTQYRRDYNSKNQLKQLNLTSAMATYNRIPIGVEEVLKEYPVQKASDLPWDAFLITQEDENVIRNDHCTIVQRILVTYLEVFKKLNSEVEWHIPHEHSDISAQPTTYTCLGIYTIDENTTTGMVEIASKLKRYIPSLPGEGTKRKLETAVNGDCKSVHRLTKVMEARLNSDNPDEMFNELTPVIQTWHKQYHLLQDQFDAMLKNESLTFSPGTLGNFRSKYGHSQSKFEVKKSFDPSYKLMRFTLHSYVVAKAMELLKFSQKKLDFLPINLTNMSKKDLQKVLLSVSKQIADFSWIDVRRAIRQQRYCVCRAIWNEEEDDEQIGCSNLECCGFQWYHRECLKNDKGVYNKPPPKRQKVTDEWFCQEKCKTVYLDKKLLYSRAIIFSGLNHEGLKSSIRENDGLRLKMYHKLTLPQLFNKNHYNYLINYHRWLAMVGGCAPPHIVNDILNNGTINWRGGKGRNVPLDLACEFQNKSLKEAILASGGNLTNKAIERRSQSLRILSEMNVEFEKCLGMDAYRTSSSKDYNKAAEDLQSAVSTILDEELLTDKGERCHDGFEDFDYNIVYVDNIVELKKRLTEYSKRFDYVSKYRKESRTGADVSQSQQVNLDEDTIME